MRDKTAQGVSIDQIYDALKIMSEYSAQKKPIFIHCREGVGRSPMITVIYLAFGYMLKDPVIRSCIDSDRTHDLNPDDKEYVENLYGKVKKYVKSIRPCCQFDQHTRYTLAIDVLKFLHEQNKTGQLITTSRDENYRFLATLVQSPPFKKLQEYCIASLSRSNRVIIYRTRISR